MRAGRDCLVASVLFVGCTSASAPEPKTAQDEPEQAPVGEVLNVPHLYWAPAVTPIDVDAALVAAVTVRTLGERPPASATRGGPLVRATLDVHEVFRAVPAISAGYDGATARTYTGQEIFVVDGFDSARASEGDKLLVFLTSYEGDYALQDIAGTNCEVGIRVESWDDPAVDAVRRYARGRIGSRELAQALGVESQWPWASVGIEETWAVAQGQLGEETFRVLVPLGLVRTMLPDGAGTQWQHAPARADGQSLTIRVAQGEAPSPESLEQARGRLLDLDLDELSATDTPRGPLLVHGDASRGELAVHAFTDLGQRPAICSATFQRPDPPDLELVRRKLEHSCASLRWVDPNPPALGPGR